MKITLFAEKIYKSLTKIINFKGFFFEYFFNKIKRSYFLYLNADVFTGITK